jgi:hypothetical protein
MSDPIEDEALAEIVRPWIRYAERRPDSAGVYEWRVPSKAVPGLIVTFFAHMRQRGAGHKDVISPAFDRWDGYNVNVPAGTEWRDAVGAPETKGHQFTSVGVEGIDLAPCPFCKKRPRWVAVEQSRDGGMFIASKPHEYNSWWLECCNWARTPHYPDPRDLAAARAALAGPAS